MAKDAGSPATPSNQPAAQYNHEEVVFEHKGVQVPAVGPNMDGLHRIVRPQWPPMQHIERGWNALTPEEQAHVQARVEATLPKLESDPAALTFFSFLAQVETIAIEIPLRFLPQCDEELRPTLRNQLVDEVFHSTLFARIAHELAAPSALPPKPYASAERLLDRIRKEKDLGVSATLLNLVAEGWIENLFKHAATWGFADDVFATVLEDETRHVEEASLYQGALDPETAAAAVARLEAGLLEVLREPDVGLAMLELAGQERYQAMVADMHTMHRKHLAEIGLKPSPAWEQQQQFVETFLDDLDQPAKPEVVPDTPWRASARKVWDTPRDPTMQGDVDIPVGHIPKKLLTPVLVAALGRAWAQYPALNRLVAKDKVWQLPHANVGVRVLIDDTELATVVITEADKRSVRDIGRMIMDGVAQLEAMRAHQKSEGLEVAPFDDKVLSLADPGPAAFSVALSNPGKFGMVRGGGAFSGALSPSTDVSIGQSIRLPKWMGFGYVPSWHVNFGCLQDHRVFDGREAGIAMTALKEQLSRKGVRAILRAKDTLPKEGADVAKEAERMTAAMPPEMQMLAAVGISKYLPIVLGGVGLGAALGTGTYFLIQHLGAQAAVEGAAGAAGVAGATDASAAAGAEAAPAAPGICGQPTAKGTPCQTATHGGACWRHGGK